MLKRSWWIATLLFLSTLLNYFDRQILLAAHSAPAPGVSSSGLAAAGTRSADSMRL